MISRTLRARFGRGPDTLSAAPAAPSPAKSGGAPNEASPAAVVPAVPDPVPTTGETMPVTPDAPAAPSRGGARLIEGTRFAGTARFAGSADRLAARLRPHAGRIGAAAGLAICAFAGGYGVSRAGHPPAAELASLRAEMARLSGDVAGVRTTLEKEGIDRGRNRAELAARQQELGDKLDRLAREGGSRTGRLSELLDRNERNGRDRVAALNERLDRMEHGGTPAGTVPTPPVRPSSIPGPVAAAAGSGPGPVAAAGSAAGPAVPDVAQTGSIGDSKAPDPRRTQIDGYFVRDVDEGFALIETRNGRFVEVAVGYAVPGIGRVETIERRGRQWVVTTPKGFIGER